MANEMNIDTGKLEAFVEKVVSDMAGTMATVFVYAHSWVVLR